MAKRRSLQLDGLRLQGCDLASIARGEVRLVLTPGARREVRRSRGVVELIASRGVSVYGINTGFGRFCDVPVPAGDMRALQVNLVRSHGAGVGEPLGDDVVRLALALRANALARGRSGIRLETLELLISLYNEDVLPWIPSQGSVGASGDLAPLAHLAQVLIGEGRARVGGRWMSGRAALRKCGLSPVRLEAKEGLSLINGVQVSCACLATALLLADTLLEAADVIGAITLDALLCSLVPFHRKIHDARPHPGQRVVARNLRHLLAASELNASHRECGKTQDAYSLRCIPQVHGAARDALRFVWETLKIEINSATDNPLVFPEGGRSRGKVLSGGNFHGAPIGYAADLLGIVLTDLGSFSERRIERVLNPDLSGLPAFLSRIGGVESGFMIAQVTAASLVSESKVLAHPASVDSIPTSAGTEDHVSMCTHAARKARAIAENLLRVVAIEMLVAVEALECRRPLRSSPLVEGIVKRVRARIPRRDGDRPLSSEIEAAAEMIREGALAIPEPGPEDDE